MARNLIAALALAVVAAGCSGGSDEPAPAAPAEPSAPATTQPAPPPPTTTAAPAPTTTTAPPPPATTTTTSTSSTTRAPLDPAELLAAMNATMGQNPEFIGTGQGYIKESADTSNADAYVTQLAVGGGPAGLDFWQLMLLEFNTPGLTASYFVQERTVAGVRYGQEPETGVWNIEDASDPDPVEDAFAGRLELVDAQAQTIATGYRITGGYAADTTILLVTVDIDARNAAITRISVESALPRSLLAGFIDDGDGDDLVLQQQITVTSYDIDTPAIAAPPVGVATQLVPDPDAPYITSIPADWVPISAAEAAQSGADFGYVGPRGITLLVLIEDLEGTGITRIGEYADALAAFVFSEMELTLFDATTTLQGRNAWLVYGRDPARDFEFRRLVYLSQSGVGVNLTFVQGPDPDTGEPTEAWADSQELLDFMINSFLVDD